LLRFQILITKSLAKIAVKNKITNTKSIHHSDRVLQYCSEIYQKELAKNNITPSMIVIRML